MQHVVCQCGQHTKWSCLHSDGKYFCIRSTICIHTHDHHSTCLLFLAAEDRGPSPQPSLPLPPNLPPKTNTVFEAHIHVYMHTCAIFIYIHAYVCICIQWRTRTHTAHTYGLTQWEDSLQYQASFAREPYKNRARLQYTKDQFREPTSLWQSSYWKYSFFDRHSRYSYPISILLHPCYRLRMGMSRYVGSVHCQGFFAKQHHEHWAPSQRRLGNIGI